MHPGNNHLESDTVTNTPMRQILQENEKYPTISFELAKGNKERHRKRRDR